MARNRGVETPHFLMGTVSSQKPISSWAPFPVPSLGRKGHLGCHWLMGRGLGRALHVLRRVGRLCLSVLLE